MGFSIAKTIYFGLNFVLGVSILDHPYLGTRFFGKPHAHPSGQPLSFEDLSSRTTLPGLTEREGTFYQKVTRMENTVKINLALLLLMM